MTYVKAPIREAVFDIRVSNLGNKTFEDFKDLNSTVKERYINNRKINIFEGNITMDDNQIQQTNSNTFFRGVIFSEKDNKRQVQFRVDGFTLNFLEPYSNWEEFSSEAFKLWKIYIDKFPNVNVERIALRYINRIEVPIPFNRIEDYVVNLPLIPKNLQQKHISFFSQIEVPCEKDEYKALITTTNETITDSFIPVILDIDVYKNVANSNFSFEDFNYIRDVKNSIFENCITDKTRELFK